MGRSRASIKHICVIGGSYAWLLIKCDGEVEASSHVSQSPPPLEPGWFAIGFLGEDKVKRAAMYLTKHPKYGVEGFRKRNHRAISSGSIKVVQM